MVCSCTLQPLVCSCNLSLNQGIFRDELKLANIASPFKQVMHLCLKITGQCIYFVSCQRSLEKVMYNNLMEYLDLCKNLFLVNLSKSITFFTHGVIKVISILENYGFVIGISLDFLKAFDAVDHDILPRKLSHDGIRGNALKWFESCLSNQKQFVTYNGIAYVSKTIVCGMPQRSVLDLFLFISMKYVQFARIPPHFVGWYKSVFKWNLPSNIEVEIYCIFGANSIMVKSKQTIIKYT